jgi:hypothetical protein
VHVPDLNSLCESESHVVLLFDPTPNAFCYLGIGSKRELLFEKPQPGILKALEAFSKSGGSWTFGWLGYDLKNEIEHLETRNPSPLGHPVLAWWEPEIAIRFSDSSVEILSGDKDDPRMIEALESIKRESKVQEGIRGEMVWSWKKADYFKALDEVKQLIQQGEVYELNLCMPLKCELAPVPSPTKPNPSPIQCILTVRVLPNYERKPRAVFKERSRATHLSTHKRNGP